MKAIIDSTSLLSLARYYMPFDVRFQLMEKLHELYHGDDILVIDKVYEECRGLQKGIVVKTLQFIGESPKKIFKTIDILPDGSFFKKLDNHFCNQDIKREIVANNPDAYDVAKQSYLNGADAKMILLGLSMKSEVVVATEETKFSNDKKVFKKIPHICEMIEVNCCPLPVFLKEYCDLDITFNF